MTNFKTLALTFCILFFIGLLSGGLAYTVNETEKVKTQCRAASDIANQKADRLEKLYAFEQLVDGHIENLNTELEMIEGTEYDQQSVIDALAERRQRLAENSLEIATVLPEYEIAIASVKIYCKYNTTSYWR